MRRLVGRGNRRGPPSARRPGWGWIWGVQFVGFFRDFQPSRKHISVPLLKDLSVILVHHTRKNAAGVAPGQSLRGSGDLHAFGDSNLYLRRVQDRLLLVSEHRAAPASPPVHLDLVATDADSIHLDGGEPKPRPAATQPPRAGACAAGRPPPPHPRRLATPRLRHSVRIVPVLAYRETGNGTVWTLVFPCFHPPRHRRAKNSIFSLQVAV
jgi:hypothetical protein